MLRWIVCRTCAGRACRCRAWPGFRRAAQPRKLALEGPAGLIKALGAAAGTFNRSIGELYVRNGAKGYIDGADDGAAVLIDPALTEGGAGAGGVHDLAAGLWLANLNVTGGAGSTTVGTTLYVEDAAIGAAATNYAVFVDNGLTRLDGGVTFAGSGQSTLSNYTEGTFTPTVTVAGGTVPVYSTNTGRYTRIGRQVFVDVYLTGDGGAEGAGGTSFTVALPITASASNPTSYFPTGIFVNGTSEDPVWGQIAAGGTTIELAYEDVLNNLVAMTGANQDNITRTVRLKFNYEL